MAESAPIDLQGGLSRRQQLLAKLMAQATGRPGAVGRPPVRPFQALPGGGRPRFNQMDLAPAPLPAINVGFHPAKGQAPPGFQADPNLPLTGFPGGPVPGFPIAPPQVAAMADPPPAPPAAPPAAPGGGQGVGPPPFVNPGPPVQGASAAPPPAYDGPIRSLTGSAGDAPDPWAVFAQVAFQNSQYDPRSGRAGRGGTTIY